MADYVNLMGKVGCTPAVTHSCPRCENPVRCDISQGKSMCWCFNVQSQARDLDMYEICVCKNCLTSL